MMAVAGALMNLWVDGFLIVISLAVFFGSFLVPAALVWVFTRRRRRHRGLRD